MSKEQEPVKTIHYSDTTRLAKTQKIKPTNLSRQLMVIGGGFSRTATVSFTLALEKLLKGPVCHGGSACLFREEEFIKKWIAALSPQNTKAETVRILKDILAGYVAVADSPSYMLTEELCAAYPDAIVIVTTRDPEKWWESFSALVKVVMPKWITYVFLSNPTLRWFGAWCDAMEKRQEAIYPPGTKQDGPQFLEVHYNYLRRVVPPEKLFFFNVKEGWAPLCKILNLPVPDEPFPHANDKLAVETAFKELIKDAMLRWIQILSIPLLAVGVGVYYILR